MEYGTLEREIHIEASPEVVFDVVSSPEHLREWWPDTLEGTTQVGEGGRFGFGTGEGVKWVRFTVVDAVPPRLFSFRWMHEEGETAQEGNSNLVVFALEPDGTGTRLTVTESGFREQGWAQAQVLATYEDHYSGWGHFLERLQTYAAKVGA
jgi:uncharacterized protein YndB with AHSA1/START domain